MGVAPFSTYPTRSDETNNPHIAVLDSLMRTANAEVVERFLFMMRSKDLVLMIRRITSERYDLFRCRVPLESVGLLDW